LSDSYASIISYTVSGTAVSGNTFDLAGAGLNEVSITVLAENGTNTTTYTVSINGDQDGDGVSDVDDAFPSDPTESVDTDSDGIGNNADDDDDGDGVADGSDLFPLDGT
jgi:hypothetical protein